MNLKSPLYLVISLIAISLLFSRCQSSKIAYGNSYYFKQTPKPTAKTKEQAAPLDKLEVPETLESLGLPEEEVLASVDQPERRATALRLMAEAKEKIDENLAEGPLRERVEHLGELAESANNENLNRKERRAFRKELKQEVKTLAKELKETYSPNNSEEVNDLDRNLKISLILLAAGLLFSILGVIGGAVGTIFVILGTLAFVAGIVFFIIWLVEEA